MTARMRWIAVACGAAVLIVLWWPALSSERDLASLPEARGAPPTLVSGLADVPERVSREAASSWLRIQVVRALDGSALEGVQLRVSTAEASWSARSDALGRAAFTGSMPLQPVDVSVAEPWWLDGHVSLAPNAFSTEVELAVGRGAVLRGRVRFPPQIQVPQGAQIEARTQAHGRRSAPTDSEGRFELRDVPPGKVRVSAPGLAGCAPRVHVLDVASDSVVDGLDFVSVPGETVRGRVRDSAGVAIVGAEVGAVCRDTPSPPTTWTMDDGAFVLEGLARNAEIVVTVRALGFARARSPERIVPRHGISGVDLVLEREASLAGVLLDAEENPWAGGQVSLFREDDGGFDTEVLETDEAGRFTFRELPAGRFALAGRPAGTWLRRAPEDAVRVDLVAAVAAEGLVLRTGSKANCSISGVVTDQARTPIKGARIEVPIDEWDVRSATTDAFGRFELLGFAADAVLTLNASEREHRGVEHPGVPACVRNLELVLEPRPSVRGRVIDRATREPVRNYSLAVLRGTEGFAHAGSVPGFVTVADHGGRFRITGLDAEQVRVCVRADGYAPNEALADLASSSSEELVIALERGRTIDGIVVGIDGPVADALVFVGEDPGLQRDAFAFARTDLAGRFHIAGAPADAHRVTAFDAWQGSGASDVPPGSASSVRIELQARSKIVGTVRVGGTSARGGIVFAHGGASGPSATSVRADGTFVLPGLAPGGYVLEVSEADEAAPQRVRRRALSAEAHEPARADFDFPALDAALEVRVPAALEASARAGATLRVEGERGDSETFRAEPGVGGTLSFPRVAAGRGRLVIETETSRIEREVTLSSGALTRVELVP